MQPTPFYLNARWPALTGQADRRCCADRFTYDPADPVIESVGLNCWAVCGQLGDRRPIEARADVLKYTTAAARGRSRAHRSDCDEALCRLGCHRHRFHRCIERRLPHGVSNPIQDGIIRASAREDAFDPTPIEPGRIYAYDIDLFATSYLVKAGHRIRVSISSSCFDRYDRNLNTGERFGTGTAIRVAHQEIHRSATHSSHILLPVKRVR
jgi:putative CocE/NonD family hydrolase